MSLTSDSGICNNAIKCHFLRMIINVVGILNGCWRIGGVHKI